MQEVLWYEHFVEPFDPDLILLAYFANDVAARGLEPGGPVDAHDRIAAWTHPGRTGAIRFLRDRLAVVDLVCDRVYRSRSLRARQDSWDSRYTEDDPGWKRARTALLRLRDRCARDGRELRVILFPYLVLAGGVFESHTALEIAGEFCRASGIDRLDGEPALLAALAGGQPESLRVSPSNFHANGEAYAALAAAVADWLAASGTPGFE